MLKNLLHRIVSNPSVYDRLQIMVGSKQIRQRLSTHLQQLPPHALVVDLGGGTGINHELLSTVSRYICLDNDPVKLKGFREKYPTDFGLLGNATQVPLQSQSVDLVLCTAVSHHIPNEFLTAFFSEAMRILKPDGRFVFMDAVWNPQRPISRLLWRYDRGSYPRPLETLQGLLEQQGKILHHENFSIYHTYLIAVVAPK
ncbi:MAG: class I SAM-dependent methyltransferase [Chloroflexi bacterium]|nr:class I SAM-dependent methyltransferase [Chloroflexota bacterium]